MARGLGHGCPSISLRHILYILATLPLLLAALAFCLQRTVDSSSNHIPPRCGAFVKLFPSRQDLTSLTDGLNRKFVSQRASHILGLRISIISTTSAGLEQVLPWLFYHRAIGVTDFFLFTEGEASSAHSAAVLSSVPGVQLVPRTQELEELQQKSRIWNEKWLAGFFYRPCNHELFVKQNLNMEMGIQMARKDAVDWIIHLDTDELLHPAGSDNYTLTSLLAEVPPDVEQVVWRNFEAAVETDTVVEPFTQVTLFKKSHLSLPVGIAATTLTQASHNNPTYFLTYMNGKAAARVSDQLRPNGAHRWTSYRNRLKELEFSESVVLHYTYTKFSDLTSRKNRCRCKLTRKDVERCIMLPFDRMAYIMASTSTEENLRRWYQEHVVWGDKTQVAEYLRSGILTRIHAPNVIIQGLREAGVFRDALHKFLLFR